MVVGYWINVLLPLSEVVEMRFRSGSGVSLASELWVRICTVLTSLFVQTITSHCSLSKVELTVVGPDRRSRTSAIVAVLREATTVYKAEVSDVLVRMVV